MRKAVLIICVCLFSGLLGGILANTLISGIINDRKDRPVLRRAPVWERKIISGPFYPYRDNVETEADEKEELFEKVPDRTPQSSGNWVETLLGKMARREAALLKGGESLGTAYGEVEKLPADERAGLANDLAVRLLESGESPGDLADFVHAYDDVFNNSAYLKAWARRDPLSTKQWIRGLPEGEGMDNAILSYISILYGKKEWAGPDALKLAESIGDEQKRKVGIFVVCDNWAQRDHKSVRQWIDESGYEAGLMQILSRMLAEYGNGISD